MKREGRRGEGEKRDAGGDEKCRGTLCTDLPKLCVFPTPSLSLSLSLSLALSITNTKTHARAHTQAKRRLIKYSSVSLG